MLLTGGMFPEGFPAAGSQQLICQRFDKDGIYGQAFGHKTVHYATLYDTKRRLPVISMTTASSLGDKKWPAVPFMIEKSEFNDMYFFCNKMLYQIGFESLYLGNMLVLNK